MMYLGNLPVSVSHTVVKSTKIKTGTFEGDGGNTVQISCDFEPDLIYVYGDLSSDVSNRGVESILIFKNVVLYETNDSSTSNNNVYASIIRHELIGYNQSNSSEECYATYSNGTLTIDTVLNSGSVRFASGITYRYELFGFQNGE